MTNIDERRLLLKDADLLMRQYRNRNERTAPLTAEQRKAWAAEMVAVMDELTDVLDNMLGECALRIDHAVAWNQAMQAGSRKVTYKVPDGPPYGGLKFTDPPFQEDPTDPRGKPPRHSR